MCASHLFWQKKGAFLASAFKGPLKLAADIASSPSASGRSRASDEIPTPLNALRPLAAPTGPPSAQTGGEVFVDR